MDAVKRSDKLWRHVVGSDAPDRLLYEEKDELFDIGVGKTRDEQLHRAARPTARTRTSSACSTRTAPTPALRTVFRRRADVEYYARPPRRAASTSASTTPARNFRLVRVDARKPDLAQAVELVAPAARADARGRRRLRRSTWSSPSASHGSLQLAWSTWCAAASMRSPSTRPAYTRRPRRQRRVRDHAPCASATPRSTTPASTCDYDLATRERVLKKRQPVLGGYDAALYASERV